MALEADEEEPRVELAEPLAEDFIDHVYTKFGEPDPDTGNDFGKVRESRKIIAWGGTTPDDEETGLGMMSHPHDGYDSETGVDYEPTGKYNFAWDADENNSMMSYIDLNWDFSQFDRDNAARHQAAGYILNANVVAGRILASKHAGNAAAYLAAADSAVAKAEKSMADHEYTATWYAARDAYELVLAGADRADVRVDASHDGWFVLPKVKSKSLRYAAYDRIGAGTHRSLP